ncbi:ABC transporter ATP-binding protein/permease [Candidatus Parcubacteria bacterium]|nr:ABC transporter ATP-binding protein/permease [Candidatus Parcubacteria bacterium]
MNKQVYQHLWRTYGRRFGQWFGFTTELVRTLMLRVLLTIIMAQAVSRVAAGDVEGAKLSTAHFLVVYIAGVLIGAAGDIVAFHSENRQYNRLLMQFYRKLTGKDMSFYRDNQTGYLATVFRQYLDSGIVLARFLRTDVVRVLVSLSVPALVLLWANWRVGLIAVGIVIVQLMYIAWASSKANRYRKMTHEVYRKLTGEVADELTNIVAFKSGGLAEAAGKVPRLAKEEIRAFWLRRKTTTLLDLPRSLATAVGVAGAFYIVVSGSGGRAESVGLIVLTLTYMIQIIRSVSELPDLITRHDDLVSKLYPTLKYLNSEHEHVKDPAEPKQLKVTNGAISIQKVNFSYPSHAGGGQRISVFQDLNIEISGGEQVGIVGLSGAGKSTLASLLMRFDDVEAGAIKIDGTDLRDVSQNQLRRCLAYVPQEPLLFHRSIRENIAYFNAQASQADIVAAARAAHAHEFIDKLPDGYGTIVGERGVKLSGGQKQRVVIARAILKNAPIMIFDEATSALDSESEKIIQAALPEIIGRHTAIVIAHRLSTVARLDRIIVIHDGVIEEEGSHTQLLERRGRYYSLWQKQTENSSERYIPDPPKQTVP